MNLTNVNITPIHIAFDEVCKKANERGVRVTGSELVGLIPLKSLLDAGRYFLEKQQRSVGVSEKEIIHIAVKSLGLDELSEFIPEKKIIEYLLNEEKQDKLVNLSLQAFANETASESPAPGGGSIAAYMGSLGISLATMVANLSAHKKGWDKRWKEFSAWAEKGQNIKDELLYLVDEDTNAFNKIMEAFSLPKSSEQEVKTRSEAIQNATKFATEVPLKTMILAYSSFPIIKAMAEIGNPNSISDAGVGALCARSAVIGAYMNVRINAAELKDEAFKKEILAKAEKIKNDAIKEEEAILKIIYAAI
jgi:glutamate formiminotransferase/formiminotetrahydrofolate cyclodeaminase